MAKQYKNIILQQMDTTLKPLRGLAKVERPPNGWIKAIRFALGMTGRQLARRIGITEPGVVAIEKREANNTITLKSLMRAAEALDCQVIYAVVPKVSLKSMVEVQSNKKAKSIIDSVIHTMSLEDQRPSEDALKRQRKRIVSEMINEMANNLWDD